MSKMVRLGENVYFTLKARALKGGKTLSATVYALTHTANNDAAIKRLDSLDIQVAIPH
jgi:hypothetical protein